MERISGVWRKKALHEESWFFPGNVTADKRPVRFLELLIGKWWLLDEKERKSVFLLMLNQLFGSLMAEESWRGRLMRKVVVFSWGLVFVVLDTGIWRSGTW